MWTKDQDPGDQKRPDPTGSGSGSGSATLIKEVDIRLVTYADIVTMTDIGQRTVLCSFLN